MTVWIDRATDGQWLQFRRAASQFAGEVPKDGRASQWSENMDVIFAKPTSPSATVSIAFFDIPPSSNWL